MRDTLAAIFLAEAVIGAAGAAARPARSRCRAPSACCCSRASPASSLGRRAFGWLEGERYERAVLAVLALTALVALADERFDRDGRALPATFADRRVSLKS